MKAFDLAELRRKTRLPIIVIFRSPKDYPGKYVARVFDLNSPTMLAVTADTLEEIRGCVPEGMTRFPRSAADDPAIVESWL